MGRRYTGPDEATKAIVRNRDQERCVICGHWVLPDAPQHHRRPRGAGGSRSPQTNSPANLLVICPKDHEWVESRRDEARENGWLVPQGKDPAEWAINHRLLGVVYLLHGPPWFTPVNDEEPTEGDAA